MGLNKVWTFLYFPSIDFGISRLSYWRILYAVIWFSALLYRDIEGKNKMIIRMCKFPKTPVW